MPQTIVQEVAANLNLDDSDVAAVLDEFALQLHKRALEYRGLNGDFIGEELWSQVGAQAYYHFLGFLDHFADRYGWERGSAGEYLSRLAPRRHWMPFRHQMIGWDLAPEDR